MATAIITFHKIIQDSQDYGSDNEHMVSRVFFNLTIDGKTYTGLYADIKQLVGGSFESSALEVSNPANYKGPFNYIAFRKIVEDYYRSLIGAQGTAIRISGAKDIRMQNNTFVRSVRMEFEVDLKSGAW